MSSDQEGKSSKRSPSEWLKQLTSRLLEQATGGVRLASGETDSPTLQGPSSAAFTSRIAPHIPYLRRYARALIGSQSQGDAYVAAVLEALIGDPALLEKEAKPRIALYRLFSSLWKSVDVDIRESAPASAWEERTSRKLQLIPSLPRQAFLLVAVEGFTTAEAATILQVDATEFSRLFDEACSVAGQQSSKPVMIIEDEALIAMDLEQMVGNLGHSVTGIARTHTEAIKLFESQRPGLVLADIQLADGSSGLDAANEIWARVQVPVIFITAFPERLLTGERPEPCFLVTKPYDPDMVRALISQALFFHAEDRVA